MRKNVASQTISAQLNSKTDGSAVTTGTTTVYVTGDAGTQASGGGTVTHEGQGCWSYVPTQAETNYSHVSFTFVNTSAISQTLQTYPVSYDPTDAVRLGLTALPNAAAAANGGLATVDASNAVKVQSGTGANQISLSSGLVTAGTVNDKTGYSLSSAGVQAIWDALTSALTTASSIGKLLVDNINATISSRLASASYTAPLDAAGTRTAVGLASANLDTQLTSIKAKTDLIPASPAAVGSAMTLAADSVTAAALAADAVAEIQSGLSTLTAAGVRSAIGLASANLDTQLDALPTAAENADAVWDEARSGHVASGSFGEGVASVQGNVTGNVAGSVASVTAGVTVTTNSDKTGYALTSGERTSIAEALLKLDLSTVTGEAARSVLNALRFLRNKWSISGIGGTTLTVTKEDDSTTAWTATVTATPGADPITGNDPS